jgi:hypothetical protein
VVPSRTDHVQSAELDHLIMAGFVRAAEPDVGAATGHLGGYRDGSQCAASAMTVASSASFLALSTTAGMPRRSNLRCSSSDSATSCVPTSTGRPVSCTSAMWSMIPSILAASVM